MSTLMRMVRVLCVVGGVVGMGIAAWAFIDPATFPELARPRMMVDPPSPRWRAAFVFVFSFALAAYGLGALRHRVLP